MAASSFQLIVLLKGATFYQDVDEKKILGIRFGKQDPYARVAVGLRECETQVRKSGGKKPVWNAVCDFVSVTQEQYLYLDFYDAEVLGKDRHLGWSRVPLNQVFASGRRPAFLNIKPRIYGSKMSNNGTYPETGMADVCLSLHETKTTKEASRAAVPGASAQNFRDGRELYLQWIFPEYGNKTWTHDYVKGRMLGKGAFGTTYLAKCRNVHEGEATQPPDAELDDPSKLVAVKVLSKKELKLEAARNDVHREVAFLQHLANEDTPNVVRLKDVYEDRDSVALVMEACTGGELFDAISGHGKYSEQAAAGLLRSLVQAVGQLQRCGVVHRDIKPENLILSDATDTATLKIIDFGQATYCKGGQRVTGFAGSPLYMAPEVVMQQDYGNEVDMWSCGVTLYILLCGVPPFGGRSEREIFNAILRKPLDLESEPWSTISDAAKDCVARMLERDPSKRATPQQILRHRWLCEGGCASSAPMQSVVHRINMNRLKKTALQLIASSNPQESMPRDATMGGSNTTALPDFLAPTSDPSLLAHQRRVLQEAFNKMDFDKDGHIWMHEMIRVLSKDSDEKGPAASEAAAIMAKVDKDGDGKISFEEFVDMMTDPCM